VIVYGARIDDQTRCIHYATALDVVAIKFVCCERYYPCHLCHEQEADHPARQWPVAERGQNAILCGVCSTEFSIETYLLTDRCPSCAASFNPNCRLHSDLYFEPSRIGPG
jgi:uncharacterized CHY-type Zn-finger protein